MTLSTTIRVQPDNRAIVPASTPFGGRRAGRCSCGGIPDSTGECAQCRARRLASSRAAPRGPRSLSFGGAAPDERLRRVLAGRFGPGLERVPRDSGYEIQAQREVTRHSPALRAAYVSDEGEPAGEEKGGQTAPTPAPAPGVFPPSPPPPTPATPGGCTYTITYANLKALGCPGTACGAKIKYDITKVTASGSGCPPKLEGLKLTESVTTDNGCTPGGVKTGAGCTIGPGGTLTGCADTYWLCEAPAAFPAAGCVEKYTQNLYIGGNLAETHTITFTITKTGTSCGGTVARS